MATKTKDYASLAAKAMYRPQDEDSPAKLRKPKVLIYGRQKKGKSTFTSSAKNVIILDPEWGSSKLKTNPHVLPVKKWEDMADWTNYLRTDPWCPKCKGSEKHKFDWVGIDGMTKISNMSLRFVMKMAEDRDLTRIPGMVQRSDYGKSGELVKDMMTQFAALDLGVIYTAQERQDAPFAGDDDDEEAESQPSSYVADLPKGVRGALTSLVDVIGRIYTVKVETGGDLKMERRLWLGPSLQLDTGYRSEFVLPDVLRQPTVTRLVRLLDTGSAKASA